MTIEPAAPTRIPDVVVARGNAWTQPLIMQTDDSAGNPIDWSGSTFTVRSDQAPISLDVDTSGPAPVVTLTLTREQTAVITGTWVYFYVAEDVVMGGNEFIEGRLTMTDKP